MVRRGRSTAPRVPLRAPSRRTASISTGQVQCPRFPAAGGRCWRRVVLSEPGYYGEVGGLQDACVWLCSQIAVRGSTLARRRPTHPGAGHPARTGAADGGDHHSRRACAYRGMERKCWSLAGVLGWAGSQRVVVAVVAMAASQHQHQPPGVTGIGPPRLHPKGIP